MIKNFDSSSYFTCMICCSKQKVPYPAAAAILICNECLRDLSEIIKQKRETEQRHTTTTTDDGGVTFTS